MSRINTNVQSMVAQNVLGRQNAQLATSLERLSTGLKINSAKDNPAGLIASENLRVQKAGTAQAITNAERANNMIGTAEGALSEVSSLMVELQSLVTETANNGGLTQKEIDANQAQVDTILGSINRIANSTTFGGKKLLDGTLDYTTGSVSSTNFAGVTVNSARLTDGVSKSVKVTVGTAAVFAQRKYATSKVGAITISVAGNKGSEILSFANSTAVSNMVAGINALKDVTGVSASLSSDSKGLYFNATDYGTGGFVTVTAVSGSFTTTSSKTATDAVVQINGQSAQVSGLTATLRTADLDVRVDMKAAFGGATGNDTFNITGGGANFMLGGNVTTGNKASIGLNAVTTSSLGNVTDGYLSSLATGGTNSLASGKAVSAQKTVSAAVNSVTDLRGKLGSFQKFTVAPTINSLQVAMENNSAAESAIRDTDFATETANLTRGQILSKVATNVLSLANSIPQGVLSLLG